MRRSAAAITILLACLALPVAAQAVQPLEPSGATQSGVGSWAEPQIRVVVAKGLMGASLATFRPEDAITRNELSELVAGLAEPDSVSPAPSPPAAVSSAPVSMAGLDSRLVAGLGLASAARQFATAARTAGLSPPSRFGTEVVARLLGLRTNHPASHDDRELLPADPATRAEAAFSAARVLAFGRGEAEVVRAAAAGIALPALDDWQRRVLDVAVSVIGYPYVWGGTSERAEAPFGVPARGGFDCSGFVWRVYKLETYDGAPELADTLKGRTTYSMSGEVAKAKRIAFRQLQPADVIFFGDRGPKSTPQQVGHMGIYLGGGWFIHSSEYGVALARLAGWYRDRFAWARRPLAEAGLVPPS